MQTQLSEQDMLESARQLVIAHEYTAAVRILVTAPTSSAAIT